MARVVVVSVAAGGGHKTVMVLLHVLSKNIPPHLEVDCFESTVESSTHCIAIPTPLMKALPINFIRQATLKVVQDVSSVFLFAGFRQRSRRREFRPMMLSGNYDAIISTHLCRRLLR